MDPAEYDYLYELEDDYWWFVGQRRITGVILDEDAINGRTGLKVLDAGAGTGGQIKQLQAFGEVTAFDFSPQATELYGRRDNGRIATASTDAIPFADASFDLVTSFDVICQLTPDQEQEAIRELRRVLKPGGYLFVRVPAMQFLHGPHDQVLHTRHRYTTGELDKKLSNAGFQTVRTTYSNTFLFPVAAGRRLVTKALGLKVEGSDVRPVPGPLNMIFGKLLDAEAAIVSRARLPFGLSAIALARKP